MVTKPCALAKAMIPRLPTRYFYNISSRKCRKLHEGNSENAQYIRNKSRHVTRAGECGMMTNLIQSPVFLYFFLRLDTMIERRSILAFLIMIRTLLFVTGLFEFPTSLTFVPVTTMTVTHAVLFPFKGDAKKPTSRRWYRPRGYKC